MVYVLLYLEKFLRRSRSTVRNRRTAIAKFITPLLWTGELRAARNATHNVRTRLKNFFSRYNRRCAEQRILMLDGYKNHDIGSECEICIMLTMWYQDQL